MLNLLLVVDKKVIVRFILSISLGMISYLLYNDPIISCIAVIVAAISSRQLLHSLAIFLVILVVIDNILYNLCPKYIYLNTPIFFVLLQFGLMLGFGRFLQPLSTSFLSHDALACKTRTFLLFAAAALGMMTFFRRFPLVYGVWSGILVWYVQRINPLEIRGLLWKSTGLVFPFLLGFMLLEGGTRVLLPVDGRHGNFFEIDEELIYTLNPGASRRQRFPDNMGNEVEWDAVISSQGIRDREYGPKENDEFRIVTIGDSFTFGTPLPDPEDTFQRQLERLLEEENLTKRVKVLNCGVSGYAPWQERIFLWKRGSHFEPDLVVLQLFPANDVAGSYTKIGKRLKAYDLKWEREVYQFQRQHEWPFYLERQCRQYSNLYRFFCSHYENVDLIATIMLASRFIPSSNDVLLGAGVNRNHLLEVCLVNWYPELYEAWSIFEESVQGIRDDCLERNVPLVAFAHGGIFSFLPEIWDQLEEEYPTISYQMNKDLYLTNEMLTRLEIPHPDMITPFMSYPDPHDLYYTYDGHFTPQGSAVVASILRDFLMRKYFKEMQEEAT